MVIVIEHIYAMHLPQVQVVQYIETLGYIIRLSMRQRNQRHVSGGVKKD
jgi:hypothetical protein